MNSEVDVFVIPHTRMKQLVKETSNQVFGTDFSDAFAVKGLLNSLNHTFHEFKHHEEIENQYILEKLKTRVTASDILDLLSNIHHDTHVKDILTLVKKAFGLEYGNSQQWLLFKVELQRAVKEFIDDFLPHMREEEEVFQPLLSTYFTRNELRNLREQVLQLHTLTLSEEKLPETSSLIKVNSNSKDSEFYRLPNELLLQIFSHLSPRDLCRCAQVCKQWSKVSLDGLLWQQLHPVRWIFRDDWRTCMDEYEPCTCNDGSCEDKNSPWDRESLFGAGDSVDSGETYEDEIDQRRLEIATNQENNIRRLVLMARYLIAVIGDHVKVLVLGCCPGLTNGLVYKILSHCKNLEHLDLSQNNISDLGLNGLFRKNGGKALRHLDLSGCAKITDKTLKKLSIALTARVTNNRTETGDEQGDCYQEELISINEGLRYISLSGCFQITDDGIRVLSRNDNLKQLTHLDLSGCLNLSARGLQDLVVNCPSLRHEYLFYCDNISEGPYPDTASGCQNLECTKRVCCRSALCE